LDILGFGRDKAAIAYLTETLELIKPYNNDKYVLFSTYGGEL
jgi:hypothetical protein